LVISSGAAKITAARSPIMPVGMIAGASFSGPSLLESVLVGERLTVADIAIANVHVNLRYAGVAPARNRWPRLRAFLDRMHSRSSFSNLVEEEAPIFDRLSGRISD
jgi:hypothetical protein